MDCYDGKHSIGHRENLYSRPASDTHYVGENFVAVNDIRGNSSIKTDRHKYTYSRRQ